MWDTLAEGGYVPYATVDTRRAAFGALVQATHELSRGSTLPPSAWVSRVHVVRLASRLYSTFDVRDANITPPLREVLVWRTQADELPVVPSAEGEIRAAALLSRVSAWVLVNGNGLPKGQSGWPTDATLGARLEESVNMVRASWGWCAAPTTKAVVEFHAGLCDLEAAALWNWRTEPKRAAWLGVSNPTEWTTMVAALSRVMVPTPAKVPGTYVHQRVRDSVADTVRLLLVRMDDDAGASADSLLSWFPRGKLRGNRLDLLAVEVAAAQSDRARRQPDLIALRDAWLQAGEAAESTPAQRVLGLRGLARTWGALTEDGGVSRPLPQRILGETVGLEAEITRRWAAELDRLEADPANWGSSVCDDHRRGLRLLGELGAEVTTLLGRLDSILTPERCATPASPTRVLAPPDPRPSGHMIDWAAALLDTVPGTTVEARVGLVPSARLLSDAVAAGVFPDDGGSLRRLAGEVLYAIEGPESARPLWDGGSRDAPLTLQGHAYAVLCVSHGCSVRPDEKPVSRESGGFYRAEVTPPPTSVSVLGGATGDPARSELTADLNWLWRYEAGSHGLLVPNFWPVSLSAGSAPCQVPRSSENRAWTIEPDDRGACRALKADSGSGS